MFSRRVLIAGAVAFAAAPAALVTLRYKVVSGGYTVSEGTLSSRTFAECEYMLESMHRAYRDSGDDYCIQVTL